MVIAAGARGRRVREAEREMAKGSVAWCEGIRQGVVPVKLFGDIVRAIA